METKILLSQAKNALNFAIDLLSKGEILAVPTETVYGFVCDWFNFKAVRKIYELKSRDFNKPLAAFCNGVEMIERMVESISDVERKLIKAFMPGPITLIMHRKDGLIDYSNDSTNKIGIRVPDNLFLLKLIATFNKPLASTSANISNNSPLTNTREVYNNFKGKIPLIIDGGETKSDIASTVIDVTVEPPKILREGIIPSERIEKILGNEIISND